MPSQQKVAEVSSTHSISQAFVRGSARSPVEKYFLAFLALCAVAKLYQSGVTVMWMDELFSYYTDRVGSIKEVIHVQNTSPLALDPPFTHIIQHLALLVGHGNLVVYRFPCFLFCSLLLGCVYLYLRRLGGTHLAIFAVCILLLRGVVQAQFDSARPYALLLGATGGALLLWQNCIRGEQRRMSLIGLFVVAGAGVAGHYYGVLLPVPFLIVEVYRGWERRKIDIPVVAALLGSLVFALSWVSCMQAAKQYRAHYYHIQPFSMPQVYSAFSIPLSGKMSWGHPVSRLYLSAEQLIFLCFLCALAFGLYAGYKSSLPSATLRAEWGALGLVALLPMFGIVLSHVAVGNFEGRFTLQHAIGVAAAFSAAVLFFLRSTYLRNGLVLLLSIAICASLFLNIRGSLARRSAVSSYIAKLNQSSLGKGSEPTIFGDYEFYLLLEAQYRDAAPFIDRMIWVYDLDRSVKWTTTDTPDRTLINLSQFTRLPIQSYDEFTKTNREFELFLFAPQTSSWLPDGIAADGGVLRPVEVIHDSSGLVGDNTLYQVHLPTAVN